ncbi:MAG: methionine biosynthesis protein MetW [Candidatus Raymondbacteria bacterium RifOxyC12_full_50_8]|uniref:Methionine biosynthesis protein MetW n=1 Tax=Candidatus Raymondbacteria bacterium RIFOXYD12_FULL_49_13 TaxID=1817890 RepID=A0A1F7FLV4_UNCRA|nr:MAG: methionine biosynthesis protein MetW [Candidatus Raymondbacteria bacterium RIFOXYA2_FULL_49_16]OGK07486.1 MAG: methionine biosynthesis protein MetW [Candidatus Raymondbacteria bacterium RIFOXYD12_FULL_49_13]OGK07772.1 MAG: methionine biosynthesis protein MetW [Candidatus Raymondbacteria bacterium RifOxyC12_full_50_8]OGP43842.1 MAG: methionine biosynthesis protein MetW [Candidatus Raymondbacteria bacterium RIFOXYB2_FULL_49_35]
MIPNIAHAIILGLVSEKSSVLDLGCGSGDLLKALIDSKRATGMGVEIDEDMVTECLRKGLSVVQFNINDGLAAYPDQSYDYVILNQTLQSIYQTQLLLNEAVRVGKRVIVGIPNFAYWRIRASILVRGKLPITRVLSHQWYNTPNIRLVTVRDFTETVRCLGLAIIEHHYTWRNRCLPFPLRLCPNLFADNAIFVLSH